MHDGSYRPVEDSRESVRRAEWCVVEDQKSAVNGGTGLVE